MGQQCLPVQDQLLIRPVHLAPLATDIVHRRHLPLEHVVLDELEPTLLHANLNAALQ
jgi:hypothetical protein